MAQVLIIFGGWPGHDPAATSAYFEQLLTADGHTVTRVNDLSISDDLDYLKSFDLLVMHWTRGELSPERFNNISAAVAAGTGLAGVHGGLLSAFQNNKKWLWLTGGCFVAHPGGVHTHYTVNIQDSQHAIMRGLKDFTLTTEQYYCLTDPAIHVLATTDFAAQDEPNATNPQPIKLPVAWTKQWGKGRIFYHTLGHDLQICQQPEVSRLTRQGFAWALRQPE